MRLTRAGAVPVVDLGLNLGTPLQQRAVLRPKIMHEVRQARPKNIRFYIGARQSRSLNELNQFGVYLQTVFVNSTRHSLPSPALNTFAKCLAERQSGASA